jgi:hypothetical protein
MAKKTPRQAEKPVAQQPDPNEVIATITLQLTRGGLLNVQGNIGDKVRAYGMLATGHDVIADWHVLQAAQGGTHA